MQAIVSVRKSVRFVLLAVALAGILFLVASHGNVADAKPPAVVNPANGHCYRYVAGLVTWANAFATAPTLASPDAACAGMTGYLVVINDAAENAFVYGLAAGDKWLGGNDTGALFTFRWMSIPGTPIFCTSVAGNCPASPGWYVNWGAGNPDNFGGAERYVNMMAANGQWNDESAVSTHPYVVEYDPAPAPVPVPAPAKPAEVPEGDTLLLLGGGMGGLGVWLRWQWSKRRR